jgi:hypothetical protein
MLCYQEYDQATPVAECKFCHQNLHLECQDQWNTTSIFDGAYPNCPFCRKEWVHNDHIMYPLM